ncbi:MAG: PaREP1 family protein [Dehalococcoidia bacterium]|nr:PaREP1 family protein [Dehalococcoidia bacterium]
MTQAEIENHIVTAERFLRHAEEEFEAGDLPQASEKAWGAVAHYLKSVAKFRGWRNRSHSDLNYIATDLSYETDDPRSIRRLYGSVSSLHQNFYEDWLPEISIAEGIEDAREMIHGLETRTGRPLDPRPSQANRSRRR